MKEVAAYLLARLGGNEQPEQVDVINIFNSVGINADESKINALFSDLGKMSISVDKAIATGMEKLAVVGFGDGLNEQTLKMYLRTPEFIISAYVNSECRLIANGTICQRYISSKCQLKEHRRKQIAAFPVEMIQLIIEFCNIYCFICRGEKIYYSRGDSPPCPHARERCPQSPERDVSCETNCGCSGGGPGLFGDEDSSWTTSSS